MTPRQFRDTLESLGLTQADAARQLGVSTRAIEYWLSGQRKISKPVEIAIASLTKKNRLTPGACFSAEAGPEYT